MSATPNPPPIQIRDFRNDFAGSAFRTIDDDSAITGKFGLSTDSKKPEWTTMTNTTKRDTARQLPPLDPSQRYSVQEAAAYLRIRRARLYQHFTTGSIHTIRDGTRRYVPGSEIARASRPPEAA